MRCHQCEAIRDQAMTSTEGKGAGKGQSSTDARREEDARIVQLNIEISTLLDEVQRHQLAITELQGEVRRLHAILEKWDRWYENY